MANEMTIAQRNRLIKKLLSQAFGQGKVTVRGSRGTGYGWVRVSIGYAPRDRGEHDALVKKIWELFDKAEIEIDTYGYDDPGSDYGYGRKIHLDFEPIVNGYH